MAEDTNAMISVADGEAANGSDRPADLESAMTESTEPGAGRSDDAAAPADELDGQTTGAEAAEEAATGFEPAPDALETDAAEAHELAMPEADETGEVSGIAFDGRDADIEGFEGATSEAVGTESPEDLEADGLGGTEPEEVPAASAPGAASDETDDEAPEPEPAVPDMLPAEGAAPGAAIPGTVATYLAAALHAAGVKFAFTVPGESFLPLLEALPDVGIKVIAARHESGASFMAEAYGQLTGRPAAVLATRAVGAANLAIGLHTARQNSTPMFVVIGQVPRAFRGREAFQEVDQVATFGGLAKWAVEIDRPAALPTAVEEGVRRALSGRPGPVLFSIPEDVLEEAVPASAGPVVRRVGASSPDATGIRGVLRLLTDAERPVILAGGGVLRARATSDLVRLAEILEVPVVAAWRRQDVFPNDHRLYLGVTGYGAADTVSERLRRADALLVLGCRLNEVASFGYSIPAPDQPWAHVDLEPRHATAGLPEASISIVSDARAFLRAARERLAGAVHLADTFDARRATNEADRAEFEAASRVDTAPWDGPGAHPGRVIAALGRVLPPEAILTTDAGNFSGWAARGYRFRRPGTFLGPTSGAMGYGLPAAISAALVHRDRPVVALAGDGGFAMTMAELETAVRERSRVIAIVFDNEQYGMIRSHQDRRPGGQGIATDLGPIDFAAIARAMGANGVRVDGDAEFEVVLRDALTADRPTVIHVPLDRHWGAVAEHPIS